MTITIRNSATTILFLSLLSSNFALAQETDNAIATCLRIWGKHPFGSRPQFKTLETSVKVFGIGKSPSDTAPTKTPSLVLINPGVNVMGETSLELLNPNGWYCLRTTVNVMGGLKIRAHCDAHLAMASEGATVLGNNTDSKGITVMGSTVLERVDCK